MGPGNITPMSLITLSASYGAGGAVIGPAVAERLGVPFLDRAIPVQVAEHLDVSVETAAAHDEEVTESFLDRVLRGFVAADIGAPAPLPAEAFTSEDFRRATEEILLRQAATGEGVILGRAGAVILRDRPSVLRVRLDGPREARIAQAMALGNLDRETAERTQRQLDRAHADYNRQFYDADIRDPSLYHLLIDSTRIPIEDCVELIVLASRAVTSSAG